MAVFIASRYTQKADGSVHHSVSLLVASSTAEAEGLDLARLREEKPTVGGWYGHDVAVSQLSKEYLLKLAEQA